MIVKAETAYKNTVARINEITENNLIDIQTQICAQMQEGEFELFWAGKLEKEGIAELKRMGYRVKIIKAVVDDYICYSPSMLKISWYGENNLSLFERVKKKIKGGLLW